MPLEARHKEYEIEIRPRAIRDMKRFPREDTFRILDRIEDLRGDLAGDVKRLTGHTLEFRLRVGDYRVLFDVEGARVIVRRIRHRREAYSE
jgi:mRNA interferase RelE/StbE